MILEVSSFQLDHIHFFRPNVSVILNITPDHMDRYQNSFELYAASKERIAMNQTHGDVFVYNADDAHCTAIAHRLAEREHAPSLAPFSLTTPLKEGGWIDHHTLTIHLNQKDEIQMPIQELALPGLHNTGNGLATAITALISGIKSNTIKEALSQFEGVEHRLEMVRELDGVRYINDSKATNVNAVWYALDSFQMPITLIMGGRDKGNDYTELESQLRSKVRAIVMIGEAVPKIEAQLSGVVPDLMKANSMAEAVRMARKMAKRGEIVLLSPACSSFDMFENYEQRGEVFKREVLSL
jgi:UDP-N-acetylmuramoylalanine--D-glutamate ligase